MKKLIISLLLIFYVIALCLINCFNLENVNSAIVKRQLPRLYIEGDIDKLKTKKEKKKVSINYKSLNINFSTYAEIKLQGTSSLNYDKKNYTIMFYKDKNLEEKYKVDLGWGEQNKYCLKANWIDKTHARNVVTANIVADVQKRYSLFLDAPNNGEIDGYPVEIYLNGDFLGLYTLNIPKDAWMFNMDEDNENNIVLSSEGWEMTNNFKKEGTFAEWEVEVGEENDETLNKLNRLLSFVANSSDKEFKNNIEKYFNLDSLLNYYVMVEFAELADNVAKNLLLVTYDGKIWYTVLYDLDTSWGTNWKGTETIDYQTKILPLQSRLWQKLERNFPNELADRYFELRKSILTKENVLTTFNDFVNSIPEEVYKKESNRWNDIPGYGIEQIIEFIDKRIPLVDKMFTNLYTEDNIVTVVYDKNDDGTVTAKLVNLREDIIGIGSDSYTFEEDGQHTFFYNDFLGNKMYIIAEAKGVKRHF